MNDLLNHGMLQTTGGPTATDKADPPEPAKKRKAAPPSPRPDALAYRVREARLMGGPGKTRIYELAQEGKLRLVRVGGQTLIDGDSLRTLLREGC